MVEQPNSEIPVYVVKREHGRGTRKLLHRNLLLPFMALPASKQNPLDSSMSFDSSQPLSGETSSLQDMTEQSDLADASRVDEVSSALTPDAEETQASPVVPRYICPHRRSKLNPLAEPFQPRSLSPTFCSRPSVTAPRVRRRPNWQTTSD